MFQRRKRRKRPRQNLVSADETTGLQKVQRSSLKNSAIVASTKRTTFNVDDSSLAFILGNDENDEPSPVYPSIPKLFEDRTTGGMVGIQKRRMWQSAVLSVTTPRGLSSATKPTTTTKACRRQWRPMAKRSIPFRALGTPRTDAVLALDRTGSYVLSLGARDIGNDVPLALALRFFGKCVLVQV